VVHFALNEIERERLEGPEQQKALIDRLREHLQENQHKRHGPS
jgi:hypothetical protein